MQAGIKERFCFKLQSRDPVVDLKSPAISSDAPQIGNTKTPA